MLLKYQNLGKQLSKEEMKEINGGNISPGGGGCIPFQGVCTRNDTCCPYTDGSPVFCSATASKPVGKCNLVA